METNVAEIRAPPDSNRPRSYNGDMARVGRIGEGIAIGWFRNRPDISRVVDLREDEEMRRLDVDCRIIFKNGRSLLAEIKTDCYLGLSGNVLFEVLRINHTAPQDKCCTLGWAARSPAQWLIYFAPQINALYLTEFARFRSVFQQYTRSVRRAMRIRVINTDAIKTTINVLIPWADYAEKVFRIYRLGNSNEMLGQQN